MKFITAAWYEFIKNIRDIKMIAIMIVFPLITIYLIGSAVQGFFVPEDMPKINVAYINQDNGAVGQGLDDLINTPELKNSLKITTFEDFEQGRRAVDDGRCSVMIWLPDSLTEELLQGVNKKILLYGTTDMEFIEILLNNFTSAFNANIAVINAGGIPVQINAAGVKGVNVSKYEEYPNLTDYYAVLVLLQILVVGSIFGSYITAKSFGSDIHIRIHSLPVNRWTLLFGRISGSVAYLLSVSTAIILFTKFIYGVNWNGNLPVMIGTIALFCFIMVGIGLLCGMIFKKISVSIMVALILMFFFGMVSGSVSPRSGVVELGFLSPNYYAKILMFGSVYGYSEKIMINSALWLLGIAVAVYCAVIVLIRRIKYDNF